MYSKIIHSACKDNAYISKYYHIHRQRIFLTWSHYPTYMTHFYLNTPILTLYSVAVCAVYSEVPYLAGEHSLFSEALSLTQMSGIFITAGLAKAWQSYIQLSSIALRC